MQQALERATRRDIETAFPSRLLLFKFREDQPRDDAGRFSSDGGGGVAAPTRTMGDVLTGMNYPEVSPYQFFNDAHERDRGGLGSAAFVTPRGTLHDIKRATVALVGVVEELIRRHLGVVHARQHVAHRARRSRDPAATVARETASVVARLVLAELEQQQSRREGRLDVAPRGTLEGLLHLEQPGADVSRSAVRIRH